MPGARWICCQLGAREHFAVPRALHRAGRLDRLITDAWVPPRSAARLLPGATSQRLRERFHTELENAAVTDFTSALVAREIKWRFEGLTGWNLFLARNTWFQQHAAGALESSITMRRPIVFGHSYAALEIARRVRAYDGRFVLGQIDPGATHFEIVKNAAQQFAEFGPAPSPPPSAYLDGWREECELADGIVVNSEWTRGCLEGAGIPAAKLHVVPLAYEAERGDAAFTRTYPTAFSASRPLRVAYVGQVAVAKGAAAMLEALSLLKGVPLQLRIVGAEGMLIPQRFRADPRIDWRGPVARSEVMQHYRECDVLLFPTLSDGFGMAQIEARAWHLPIIASRRCGAVVEHEITGLLLDDPTPAHIAAALERVAAAPALLASFAAASARERAKPLSSLAGHFERLES
jgi:glycosyltransferase involved in cell wall biosynthesis